MEYGGSYESSYTPSVESSAESVDVSADTSIDSSTDVSSEEIEASTESVDTDFDFDAEDMTAESGTEISEGDIEGNAESVDSDFDFDTEDMTAETDTEIPEGDLEPSTESVDDGFVNNFENVSTETVEEVSEGNADEVNAEANTESTADEANAETNAESTADEANPEVNAEGAADEANAETNAESTADEANAEANAEGTADEANAEVNAEGAADEANAEANAEGAADEANAETNAESTADEANAEANAEGAADEANAEANAEGTADEANAEVNAEGAADEANAEANAEGATDEANAEANAEGAADEANAEANAEGAADEANAETNAESTADEANAEANAEGTTDEAKVDDSTDEVDFDETIEDNYDEENAEYNITDEANPEGEIEDMDENDPEDLSEENMDEVYPEGYAEEDMDSVDPKNVDDVEGGNSEGIAEDSIDGSNAAEQNENNPNNVDNVEASASENANGNRAQEGNLRDESGKENSLPERASFIGAKGEKDRIVAVGIAADAIAEMQKAEEAKAPEMHRGETVVGMHDGHSNIVIASTESKNDDIQHQDTFREINVDSRPPRESATHIEDVVEEPRQQSMEEKSEKKVVAEVDPDDDANQQLAIAMQAMNDQNANAMNSTVSGNGTVTGLQGENLSASSTLPSAPADLLNVPVGATPPPPPSPPPNDPTAPNSPPPPGGPIGIKPPAPPHFPLERFSGRRVRVEIPLMSGKLAEGAKIGLALQFGRKLSQIERVLKEMPHPADSTQADAVFADTLKENKVRTKDLGFEEDDISTENIEAFRKARGLHWAPCSDKKSLILVKPNGIPYVEGLESVSEEDDNLIAAAETKHGEVIERTKEEFEKNLEEFRGSEKATYENQKKFELLESGLRKYMDNVLSDYTGHSIEHVQEVIEEGHRILDALEASGIVIPEKTKRAYSLAAKYHDIGMAENHGMNAARELQEKLTNFDGNFDAFAQYFNLDQNMTRMDELKQRYSEIKASVADDSVRKKEVKNLARMQLRMQDAKELAAQIREMSLDDPNREQAIKAYNIRIAKMQSAVFGSLRANHAQKSAEYILQYGQTDEFKERYGSDINSRNVACAIMLHTKTNSGCGDLDLLRRVHGDGGSLSVEEASSRLIANWNQKHKNMRVETTFSQDDLLEIAELASVLRTADNRRDGETANFTSGDRVVCDASGEKVRVFHSKELEGKTVKDRELVSQESVRIISSEACTQFGDLRPEGRNLIHTIDFNGKGSAQLEQAFVYARIVDYVCEVESGVFKSGRNTGDESTTPHGFNGDNILEIRVDTKSQAELDRMQADWQRWLSEGAGLKHAKWEIAKEYGKPGRIRLVSKGSNN